MLVIIGGFRKNKYRRQRGGVRNGRAERDKRLAKIGKDAKGRELGRTNVLSAFYTCSPVGTWQVCSGFAFFDLFLLFLFLFCFCFCFCCCFCFRRLS